MKFTEKRNYDFWGMGVSLLCAVHCLIFPILSVFSVNFAGEIFHHPLVEFLFIFLALFFAFLSLWKTYKIHQNKMPIVISCIGFCIIFSAHLLLSHDLSHYFVAIGGVVLVASHVKNWLILKG